MIATEMAARFRLRELLEVHEPPMNQSELARLSGVSIVTVNAIANNRTTRVDLATLEAIASALGAKPAELIDHVPKQPGRRR